MVQTTLSFLFVSSVLVSLVVLAVLLLLVLLVAEVIAFDPDLLSVCVLEHPANIPHTITAIAVNIIILFFIFSPL